MDARPTENVNALAAQAMLGRLSGADSAIKRITEQAAAALSQATQGGASFDTAAKQAREIVLRGTAARYAESRAVSEMLESQREQTQKFAARRRAVDNATLETPELMRALIEMTIADREEGRFYSRLIVTIAALTLLVSIIGLAFR
jgi:hypothetical protein